MKTILNLKGVKNLTKKEQQEISGANASNRPWCGGRNLCCMYIGPRLFCDSGRCQPNGRDCAFN